jgi:hypothetical protein
MSNASVELIGQELVIHVTIENVGTSAGPEVIQYYIAQDLPSTRQPRKELQAFEKVFFAPSQRKIVGKKLSVKYATRLWDEARGMWICEKGIYRVCIGNSSDNIAVEERFEAEETYWWNGLQTTTTSVQFQQPCSGTKHSDLLILTPMRVCDVEKETEDGGRYL